MSIELTNRAIAICICTFKRTTQLAGLLPQLAQQMRRSSGWSLRLVIVDNDPNQSARTVCDSFRQECSDIRLDYLWEPSPGVGNARNTALGSLNEDEGLIFFDDDQEPVAIWLQELLSRHLEAPQDILVGPVIPLVSEPSPSWARDAWAWGRRERIDGSTSRLAGFGNMLIPANIANSELCRVPPRFCLGPGEDTVVTLLLTNAGFVIRHVAEAKAFERVTQERMQVPWLCQRSRISGETWVAVVRATGGSEVRLWLSMFKLVASILFLASRSLLSKDPSLPVKLAVTVARSKGYVQALVFTRGSRECRQQNRL